jgi:hypothetical protein
MKFFRLDLLTLLISLFILNSCKRQDGIGLGINGSNQINGSLVVDTNITIRTEIDSSIVTSGLAKTPMGDFADPEFGGTKSDLALGLGLPTVPYTAPAGTITIDSAVMVLRYADGFYGDSIASRFKVNVYQLKEKASSAISYYSNRKWQVDSTLALGSKTFTAHTHDSVTIALIRTAKVDTIQKVGPQLRIPFSKKFIYDNLLNATGTQLASNTTFLEAVKGLYVTLDREHPTDAGGIIQLKLDSSRIDVFYKAVNGATIDTAVATLSFPSYSAAVRHTYTTTIKAALASTTGSQNDIYLQGLAGLRAKVSFPGLEKLNPDSVVLNRVELVISPRPGSAIPYAPLAKLGMYQLDIANQRTYIQDSSPSDPRNGGPSVFGGFYNKAKKEYRFIITAYIQDLILKKTKDYGTFIAPVDTTVINSTAGVDYSPTVQNAARTKIVGSDKSPYSIKLNIIYTKIRK